MLQRMVFHTKISAKTRAYAYYLRLERGISYRKVADICKISPSSVVRISREGLQVKQHKERAGRSSVMNKRERARFLRTFKRIRNENSNIKVMDIAKESEITRNVSYRTLVRVLNQAGYKCLRPRRKGVLS